MKPLVIAVDFDGTMVEHLYPAIGKDIGAVPVLQELVAANHRLILFTMRTGQTLADAISWCASNGIELWGVNVNPSQHHWSESPKVFAHLYIDDAGIGTPLIASAGGRPYVDWVAVRNLLVDASIL